MTEKNERIANLIRALGGQFSAEECAYLAKTLSEACETESIAYEQVDIPMDWKDDILLVAYEERLLLPMRSRRGSAWEDRIQNFCDGEVYHMPRVVRGIVLSAAETASWDTESAIAQALQEAGEDQIDQIIPLLGTLMEMTPGYRLGVERMQSITASLGLQIDMHDTLDRFVRCGIMSACTQGSLRSGTAEYEINRCLYWKSP